MYVPRLLIVLCCLAMTACDRRSAPAPPVVPPTNETINGTERLGWDQRAADAVELATIGYVLYIDGTRTPLPAVNCAADASAAGFACNARLPAMAAGAHTLQLASFVSDGTVLESARSASFTVTVVPQTTVVANAAATGERVAPRISPETITTADGVRMRVERVVDGLQQPTDLSFAPDGGLLIAERGGTIRMLPGEARRAKAVSITPLPEPALSLAGDTGDTALLALAVDPQFDRTRFVFALYAAPARSGEPTFTLARFRESSGTLADRVILLDGIGAATPTPAAALRFGGDGKLYAAFDDGGDARRQGDRASLNGKIVRLNPDGTTPEDQAGSTPVYSEGYRSPAGFDWDPRRAPATLWIADRGNAGAAVVRAVVADPSARAGEQRGVVRGTYALRPGSVPASVAFYRGALFPALAGSLLVASDEGRHLLRIAGDRVEALLEDRVGGIRAVAIAPDGAIYFANATAIGRLVPDVR
jgi:glucose/arabinose dehydrogenase